MKNVLRARRTSIIVISTLIFAVALTIVTAAIAAASEKITYIRSVEGLKNIRNDLNGHYKVLSSEIIIEEPWAPIGTKDEPFTGTFDGDGVTITNISFDTSQSENNDYCGFFGYNAGTIIHTNFWLGGQSKTFSFASEESYSFGIAAGVNEGKVTSCSVGGQGFTVELNGGGDIGILVGTNYGDIRNNAINTGIIATTNSGNLSVGMLAGSSRDDSIIELNNVQGNGSIQCDNPEGTVSSGLAAGTISGGFIQNNNFQNTNRGGDESLDSTVGGIVGKIVAGSSVTIDSCHVGAPVGSKEGPTTLGGLVGSIVSDDVSISNCLFSGNITSSGASPLYYGELVGKGDVDISNSYYTREYEFDGTLNRIGEKASLSDLTIDEMGWDSEFWSITDGVVTFTRKAYS